MPTILTRKRNSDVMANLKQLIETLTLRRNQDWERSPIPEERERYNQMIGAVIIAWEIGTGCSSEQANLIPWDTAEGGC